jgi:hypothetical protein
VAKEKRGMGENKVRGFIKILIEDGKIKEEPIKRQGATYPNQTFTGWIPASSVSKSPILSDIEGKHVKITGRIEMYKGKPETRINAASQLEVE